MTKIIPNKLNKLNPFKEKNQHPPLPIKTKNLIRLLVIIIVVLAFLAGYFQAALKLEKKKYAKLEDKFNRLERLLGEKQTQRLLEQSKQDDLLLENNN